MSAERISTFEGTAADIKRGDWVLIGTSALADPVAAGAREVRAVERFGDTFERTADDYLIGTI